MNKLIVLNPPGSQSFMVRWLATGFIWSDQNVPFTLCGNQLLALDSDSQTKRSSLICFLTSSLKTAGNDLPLGKTSYVYRLPVSGPSFRKGVG